MQDKEKVVGMRAQKKGVGRKKGITGVTNGLWGGASTDVSSTGAKVGPIQKFDFLMKKCG